MSTYVVVLPLSLGSPGGTRFMVKDTLDVAGVPTRASSRTLSEAPAATAHAEVVQRLLDAGWQLCGKTNLHELAFGTTGINHWTGTPVNPRWPDRVPGGSSCGSAVAVALGLVPMALGTDTGGSVRTPAACCGVFGLKPTYGRVSRCGVMPPVSSLDCVGPMASDMAVLIRAMQAMAPDFGPLPAVPPVLRIGMLKVQAAPAALEAVQQALARGPHQLQELHLSRFDDAYQAGLSVINRENWKALSRLLDDGRMGPDLAVRLTRAGLTTDEDVARAEVVRTAFQAEVDAALAHHDVLALPTLSDTAPRIEDAADTSAAVSMTSLVRPFNLSGHPAITLPLDNADGLPVGLQLVAKRGADEWLCAVAQTLSHQLNLHTLIGEHA